MEEIKQKIMHDLNSGISAVEQSLEIILEHSTSNVALSEKMLPLCFEKMKEVSSNWEKIKEYLK